MVTKVYISNISGMWSEERQRGLLGDAVSDLSLYRDWISGVARKQKRISALKDRASLLASFRVGAGDELHVASFANLFFDASDLLTVTAATDQLGVTIVAYEPLQRIEPGARPTRLAQARDAMAIAQRGHATEKSRELAAKLKRDRTLERVELIRGDWPKPSAEFSTKALLERAGEGGKPMAPATARAHLGSRPDVQHRYAMEQAREAGRKAGREKKAAAKERAK